MLSMSDLEWYKGTICITEVGNKEKTYQVNPKFINNRVHLGVGHIVQVEDVSALGRSSYS